MKRQSSSSAAAASSIGRIASLDVVVRPAKRTGRGLKTIVESPVKALATQLGLPIHERDTFTGWTPVVGEPPFSSTPNLIVAVSFGLFVPSRLLRAARYGGLNVHPSLLPDLHGAAPFEHALLLARTHTGVTVQTLHETTFDGGRRLLQGPVGGKEETAAGIEIPPRCTSADLHALLAPIGASLLIEVLRQGLYLPGSASLPALPLSTSSPAPKLTKGDRQVPWRSAPGSFPISPSSSDIDRRARALGPLWTHLVGGGKRTKGSATKRVILDRIDLVKCPIELRAALGNEAAQKALREPLSPIRTVTFAQEDLVGNITHVTLPFIADGDSIVVPVGVDLYGSGSAAENKAACLRIGTIKVEGDKAKPAARVLEAVASTKDVALAQISWDVALSKRQDES